MRQLSVDEVERALLARGTESQVEKMRAEVRTSLALMGLSRSDIVDVVRQIRPGLPDEEEEFVWLNLLQDLWESPYFESRLLALQLMYASPDLVDAHLWGMLDHWNNAVDNWVLADWLGHVRAIAVAKSPALVSRMAPWLQSKEPWRRRSVLVSLVQIDAATRESTLLVAPHELFVMVKPVINDPVPAVRTALAWLLRCANREYADEVGHFLHEHRAQLPAELAPERILTSASSAVAG